MSSTLEPLKTCSVSSLLPRNVTFGFIGIYGVLILSVSIYSFLYLMRHDERFIDASCWKKIKKFFKDVWKRKGCYAPMLTHLFDQITDIAVIIEFYLLAERGNSQYHCEMNMYYLFYLSLFVMIEYRVISGWLIYKSSGSFGRLLVQLFDGELFRTIYINYLCRKTEPCNPQRWLTALESTFESAPQALIQFIYLIRTQGNASEIVTISLVWSIISLISKITADDKIIMKENAKQLNFDCAKWERRWSIRRNCCSLCSWEYIIRYIFRIFDVSSRIFSIALIWISVGGTATTFIVFVDVCVIIVIAIKNKNATLMLALIGTLVGFQSGYEMIFYYRWISNLFILALITSFFYIDFECWRCTDFDERSKQIQSDFILSLFIYCWITCAFNPLMYVLMKYAEWMENATNSREIEDMIKTNDWSGILELKLFASDYGYCGDKTLLMLAVAQNDSIVVQYLQSKVNVNEKDRYYGITALMLAVYERNSPMTELLIECGVDVNVTNDDGFTAYEIATFIRFDDGAKILKQYVGEECESKESDERNDGIPNKLSALPGFISFYDTIPLPESTDTINQSRIYRLLELSLSSDAPKKTIAELQKKDDALPPLQKDDTNNDMEHDGNDEKLQLSESPNISDDSFISTIYPCKRCIHPVRNNVFMEKTVNECNDQEVNFEVERLICCLHFLDEEYNVYHSLREYLKSTNGELNDAAPPNFASVINKSTKIKSLYIYLRNVFEETLDTLVKCDLVQNKFAINSEEKDLYECTPTMDEKECYLSLYQAVVDDSVTHIAQSLSIVNKIRTTLNILRNHDIANAQHDRLTLIENILSVLLYRDYNLWSATPLLGELQFEIVVQVSKGRKLTDFENRDIISAIVKSIQYAFVGVPKVHEAEDNGFKNDDIVYRLKRLYPFRNNNFIGFKFGIRCDGSPCSVGNVLDPPKFIARYPFKFVYETQRLYEQIYRNKFARLFDWKTRKERAQLKLNKIDINSLTMMEYPKCTFNQVDFSKATKVQDKEHKLIECPATVLPYFSKAITLLPEVRLPLKTKIMPRLLPKLHQDYYNENTNTEDRMKSNQWQNQFVLPQDMIMYPAQKTKPISTAL